ncbi:MAG TPA: hypothetical protein VEW68_03990 [Patescibacteria group bacterium]|nr:hypothetical protein [Patescibacteria group bacterium]
MRRVLLLAADRSLSSSVADLLRLDGISVTVPDHGAAPSYPDVDLVIASCDSWPSPWTLQLLRSRYRAVPCLLLSGSPVSGPYATAGFKRGYFLGLPAEARRISELAGSLLK